MSDQGDVLDSGTPPRPRRWIVLAVVAVVAVVGWRVVGSEPDPAVDRSGPTGAAEPPPEVAARPAEAVPSSPEHADQLTFADATNGYLVQYRCSEATAEDPCPRRIYATDDGGSTWQPRAVIPPYAAPFQLLVADSAVQLTLFDQQSIDSVVRSFDGGRSWAQLPVTRGEPAPAPLGARLLQLDPQPSAVRVRSLAWFEPEFRQLHPVSTQPWERMPPLSQAPSRAPDGDILTASSDRSDGRVLMSRDGGLTWTGQRLAVPLAAGEAVEGVTPLAAGGGRGFAFVQVYGSAGVTQTYGFRTDDGGRHWIDIRFDQESIWLPAGVLNGGLIATDLPGRILLSTSIGTRWAEAGTVANGPYLSQVQPDAPVLATVLNSQGFERYLLSTDGFDWIPIVLPEV